MRAASTLGNSCNRDVHVRRVTRFPAKKGKEKRTAYATPLGRPPTGGSQPRTTQHPAPAAAKKAAMSLARAENGRPRSLSVDVCGCSRCGAVYATAGGGGEWRRCSGGRDGRNDVTPEFALAAEADVEERAVASGSRGSPRPASGGRERAAGAAPAAKEAAEEAEDAAEEAPANYDDG